MLLTPVHNMHMIYLCSKLWRVKGQGWHEGSTAGSVVFCAEAKGNVCVLLPQCCTLFSTLQLTPSMGDSCILVF